MEEGMGENLRKGMAGSIEKVWHHIQYEKRVIAPWLFHI